MDPSTLAYATAASTAASSVGRIAQGYSTSASDKANAQIASNNAAIATQNASFASQEGNANAEAAQLKNRAAAGTMLANQGASGVDINSSSSVATRKSQDILGNLDVATIRSNAARQAYGFETQATNYENQASIDKASAKNAVTAGYIGAGTSLLSRTTTAAEKGTYDPWLTQTNSSSLNSDSLNQVGPFDNSLPWRNQPTGQ